MHVSGQEDELKAALRVWVRNAMAFLHEQTHTGRQLPQFRKSELSYDEPGGSILDTVEITIPDIATFIEEHRKSLMLLDGYIAITLQLGKNEHSSYHLGHLLGTDIGAQAILPDYLLHKFVAKMWWPTKAFQFHEEAFEDVYRSLMEFFSAPFIKCKCITPLLNLKMEQTLELSTNVKIRNLEEDEFDIFFVNSEIFRRLFGIHFKGTRLFVTDCDIPLPKPLERMKTSRAKDVQDHFLVDVASGRRLTEDVRSVLHIFKSGALKTELMLVDIADGWGYLSTFSSEDVDKASETYSITTEEIEPIKKLWEVYDRQSWSKHKFLRVAIDRLNYGLTRARAEDRIIDYVVSLEAILLHDLQPSDRGELRNRFALRGARLLASTLGDRKRIFRDLRGAYDVRSAIVHGASNLPLPKNANADSNVNDFVELVSTYLRTLIKTFLDYAETGAPVLVDWDNVLLS